MVHRYVADFMADDAKDLVVRHQVHKAGINAHAAVGACKSIDIVGLINLEVKRHSVHLRKP